MQYNIKTEHIVLYSFAMHRKTALTWSWLGVLTKPRYDAISEIYGNLDDALAQIGAEFLKGLGCRQDTIEKALTRLEGFDAAKYEAELLKRGINFLDLEDEAYPARLREIGDPPIFLYYRGDLSVLDQPCIALVGTRKMSSYGKRVTEHFTESFVRAGVVTVSGLALGIDAEVAKVTLGVSGRTVAALGHGLGMIYPKSNSRLADEIVAKGGLLLSEFPLDQAPDTYTFPARNRIIAGLTLGTVVLEAPAESGAIITADLALDYNRDLFVVPGQIFDENYSGSHALISRGNAKLVMDPTDVLQELGIVAPKSTTASAYVPLNADEARLMALLTTMPQPVDSLVEKSALTAGKVSALLTMMELGGAVKNVGGGWVRS